MGQKVLGDGRSPGSERKEQPKRAGYNYGKARFFVLGGGAKIDGKDGRAACPEDLDPPDHPMNVRG